MNIVMVLFCHGPWLCVTAREDLQPWSSSIVKQVAGRLQKTVVRQGCVLENFSQGFPNSVML